VSSGEHKVFVEQGSPTEEHAIQSYSHLPGELSNVCFTSQYDTTSGLSVRGTLVKLLQMFLRVTYG
jgi:hypothetical protein